VLAAAGVELEEAEGGLVARRLPTGLTGTDLQTRPYPGFATDLQSPVMAMLATAKGASAITETIFEQRFRHLDELRKMGANIAVHGRTAWVREVERHRCDVETCSTPSRDSFGNASDEGGWRPTVRLGSFVGVDGPRRHRCAKVRSLLILDRGDRPWNRLAALAWIRRNTFSSFMA